MEKLNRNLTIEEQELILKALVKIANDTCEDNRDFILNRVLKTENFQIRNDFGLYSKRTNSAKTIQDKINANKKTIEKLIRENEALEKSEDKTAIIVEESTILVSEISQEALDKALEIIKLIIPEFNSKRIQKSLANTNK